MNEILPHLWLGDLNDSFTAPEDFIILCVLEVRYPLLPKRAILQPILEMSPNGPQMNMNGMEKACKIIDGVLNDEKNILVHCAAGVERSPLTIVWWLHTRMGQSLDVAYDFVKSKRSIVENRLIWLPKYFRYS